MKRNKTTPNLITLLGACSILITGGCTAALLDTTAHNIFIRSDTNFTEKNYAAADYLIQQAKSYVSRHSYIVAKPLNDIDHPEMSSTFGKMIPEQIGVRLSQLGYRLNLENVALSPDTNYLRPADTTNKKPDFILTGTFMRQRTNMNVSLRMVNARNNQIIAVFEYPMPLTGEIADLAQPEPKIIRMTK